MDLKTTEALRFARLLDRDLRMQCRHMALAIGFVRDLAAGDSLLDALMWAYIAVDLEYDLTGDSEQCGELVTAICEELGLSEEIADCAWDHGRLLPRGVASRHERMGLSMNPPVDHVSPLERRLAACDWIVNLLAHVDTVPVSGPGHRGRSVSARMLTTGQFQVSASWLHHRSGEVKTVASVASHLITAAAAVHRELIGYVVPHVTDLERDRLWKILADCDRADAARFGDNSRNRLPCPACDLDAFDDLKHRALLAMATGVGLADAYWGAGTEPIADTIRSLLCPEHADLWYPAMAHGSIVMNTRDDEQALGDEEEVDNG